MSVIVKTATHWVVAFIFVYGLHVVAYGHISPGGGFAGGVVIASAFVLLVLAWGKRDAFGVFGYGAAKSLDSVGALSFLVLALLGLVSAGGVFFVNFVQQAHPGEPLRLFNGGIIPLANVAIAVKVASSLFLVAVVLAVLRVRAGAPDNELTSQEE